MDQIKKYWIGVAHQMHVEAGKSAGFCAFSHGKESAIKRLSIGDEFIYYAPRDKMEGADFCPFMRPADYEDVRPFPVRPLLEDLSFVRNKQSWGMAFRRSLFDVSESDFTIISNALRGSE
jgi:hypothetical protein